MDELIKNIIRKERIVLFLGAGFSIGAKMPNGNDILYGKFLHEHIITGFLKYEAGGKFFDELMQASLQDLCSFAAQERGEGNFTDFLCDLYRGTEPAKFHYLLDQINCRKIYTTNIDDVVENVIGHDRLVVQNSQVKSSLRIGDKVEYIKLHGDVNNPSAGLVFTSSEYVTSMSTSTDYRFQSLMYDVHRESIFFIGTSFNEINIDYFLAIYKNSGYGSYKGKLVFVNPSPSLLFQSKIRKYDGVIIKKTAEDFFNDCIEVVNEQRDDRVKMSNEIAVQGIISYRSVRESSTGELETYRSKLYSGAQPVLLDIFYDWDFENPELRREVKQLMINYDQDASYVISLVGKALTGKSTYLKRIGFYYFESGYDVFLCDNKFFNEIGVINNIIKNESLSSKKIALIVDNGSYLYKSFGRIIRAADACGVHVVVLTSSRPIKHGIKYQFLQRLEHEVLSLSDTRSITKVFAQGIIDKLALHGYEGSLIKHESNDSKVSEIVRDGDIIKVLYRLFNGDELRSRIDSELKEALNGSKQAKNFFDILCLFEHLELSSFPIEIGSQIFGAKSTSKLIKNMSSILKIPDVGSVSLRTRFKVVDTVKRIPASRKKDLVVTILKSLSSKVVPFESNYWSDIHATFNKYKFLKKYLGLSHQDIIEIYDRIRPLYKDNYNYWLQLGIAEQRNKQYDEAYNHLSHAKSLPNQVDSYMINTCIGGNFMKKAIDQNNKSIASGDFRRGETILSNLINSSNDPVAKAYASHSLVSNKIKFVEKYRIRLDRKELIQMNRVLENVVVKGSNDNFSIFLAKKFKQFAWSQGEKGVVSTYIWQAINNHRSSLSFNAKDVSVDDMYL